MFRSVITTAFIGVVAACAAASSNERPTAYRGLRPTSDFVTLDELRRHDDTSTLFEALARARPRMLRPRFAYQGIRSTGESVDVFINGHYSGGIEVLRSLHPVNVASVRMAQRSEAFMMHGARLRGEHALFVTLVR